MALSEKVLAEVSRAVKVFYIDRKLVKRFNQRRKNGEPMVFCGWYWSKGSQEGGPFMTPSACRRDAWYNVCLKMTPPPLRVGRVADKPKPNQTPTQAPPRRRQQEVSQMVA